MPSLTRGQSLHKCFSSFLPFLISVTWTVFGLLQPLQGLSGDIRPTPAGETTPERRARTWASGPEDRRRCRRGFSTTPPHQPDAETGRPVHLKLHRPMAPAGP